MNAKRAPPTKTRRNAVLDIRAQWSQRERRSRRRSQAHVDRPRAQQHCPPTPQPTQQRTTPTKCLGGPPIPMQDHQKCWISKLSESPRKPYMNHIDPKLPSGSFLKLTALMNKRQTMILTWLHTGHCPLNQYLKRITKSPTDKCAHCIDTPEVVIHYLLRCPLYARQCHILKNKISNRTFNILHMLSTKHAAPHLLTYVKQTGHLKASLGKPHTQ